MNRQAAIPAMERLGADFRRVLREGPKRRAWWRAHPFAAACLALSLLAVPAVATQVRFADLINGETALPTQAPAAIQAVLAEGSKDSYASWRLVAYRARLAGQPAKAKAAGLCVFVRQRQGGRGRCVPAGTVPPLTVASEGSGVIAGLVAPAAATVEVVLRDGRRLAVAPREVGGRDVERAGLPAGLRFFVVEAVASGALEATGMLVRDGSGRELARSGRPSPLPPDAATVRSPVQLVSDEEGP